MNRLSAGIVIVGLLLIFHLAAFSQDESPCPPPENKKAEKIFKRAMSLPSYQASETKKYLLEVVKMVPEHAEAWLLLGDIYIEESKNDRNLSSRQVEISTNRALSAYEKCYTLCPEIDHYRIAYILGKHAFDLHDYVKAEKFLHTYLDKNKDCKSAECNEAREMVRRMDIYFQLINNPVPFNPVKVMDICTSGDEYLPLISPDGDLFFYTQHYIAADKYTTIQKEFEEFKVANRLKSPSGFDEYFSKGSLMPRPFNTGANQGGVSVSIDNQQLFITRCDFVQVNMEPYNNCDIFYSQMENGEWTQLLRLPETINSRNTWEGQPSVSSDGKTLFFASARPGCIGGTDIFYSRKDENGNWGKAQNIGPVINTEGNDKSPFIHSDSKTLYFTSDGIPGVGGFDIFFSKQIGENEWSLPVNIGYPINNEADDLGFVVSTDGKKAYFSSNTLNNGSGWDVYSFDLYEAARPEQVLFVKGQLLDDQGAEITDAKVEVKNVETSRITEAMVDKLTGKYAVAIPIKPKDEFLLTVRKEEFAFTSRYIKPEEEEMIERPVVIDFEVKPIEIGVTVKLNNILFATNSAEFDNASRVVLESFTGFLNDNPNVKISIQGHTDNVGTPASNIDLSNRRAKAVYDYLISNGITSSRLSWKGFGQAQPVADNATDEGKALNRRTEFLIVEK